MATVGWWLEWRVTQLGKWTATDALGPNLSGASEEASQSDHYKAQPTNLLPRLVEDSIH